MPTYEYRCTAGHEFEKVQRMSEDPIRECPTCGAPAERQLSAGGLVFKGTGFYITDYARSESYKKAAAAETASSETTSPKDAPKDAPKEPSKAPAKEAPSKADPPAASSPKPKSD